MAGDWIKVRTDLPDDPAVLAMSVALGRSVEEVVGGLVRFWVWADAQTTDGDVCGIKPSNLDPIIRLTGFGEALVDVGWLEVTDFGLRLPKFDRHMSKSAKQRALTNKRVGAHRAGCNAPVTHVKRSCNAASVTEALPEKRREEKRRDDGDDASSASVADVSARATRAHERPLADAPVGFAAEVYERLRHHPWGFRSHTKLQQIIERGTTAADLDAWERYAQANGRPAASSAIQEFARPSEIPADPARNGQAVANVRDRVEDVRRKRLLKIHEEVAKRHGLVDNRGAGLSVRVGGALPEPADNGKPAGAVRPAVLDA